MKAISVLAKCAQLIAKAQGERAEILKAIQSGIVNKKQIVIEEKSDNTGELINDCFCDLGIVPQKMSCIDGSYVIKI